MLSEYFVHVLLDCNLFEIISYGFRNIKAINSLCQQPSAQLILRPGFNINKIIKESKLTVLTHDEVASSTKGAGQLFAHAQ